MQDERSVLPRFHPRSSPERRAMLSSRAIGRIPDRFAGRSRVVPGSSSATGLPASTRLSGAAPMDVSRSSLVQDVVGDTGLETSDLLNVKRIRLSAVLRAWGAERKRPDPAWSWHSTCSKGVPDADLPPAHVGRHAGPGPVPGGGDSFGQTVRRPRIADYARPGEVLVSQVVVDASQGADAAFTKVGPVELKGATGLSSSWRLIGVRRPPDPPAWWTVRNAPTETHSATSRAGPRRCCRDYGGTFPATRP